MEIWCFLHDRTLFFVDFIEQNPGARTHRTHGCANTAPDQLNQQLSAFASRVRARADLYTNPNGAPEGDAPTDRGAPGPERPERLRLWLRRAGRAGPEAINRRSEMKS
jgi:hypothetical protein